jgi:hypothetical protein
MKRVVLNCTRRIDGKYQVIIADTVGGKNTRMVIADRPVSAGHDVEVRDGKVVQS